MSKGVHAVAVSDDGLIVTLALDGVPVRGLVGYEVSRRTTDELPEVTIRIRAGSVNGTPTYGPIDTITRSDLERVAVESCR